MEAEEFNTHHCIQFKVHFNIIFLSIVTVFWPGDCGIVFRFPVGAVDFVVSNLSIRAHVSNQLSI
jgi:hypothetical protein